MKKLLDFVQAKLGRSGKAAITPTVVNELIKYGLLGYHIEFFKKAEKAIDFRDKTILEIGGSNMPRYLVFDILKAKSYVCIDYPWESLKLNSDHYKSILSVKFDMDLDTALKQNNYVLYEESAEYIPESFYNKFDVVLSNCAFEHIVNLHKVLEKLYFCLKKSGVLFSEWGTIFSSAYGSHFWINDNFNFGNNTLSPWPHLLLSYSELVEKLKPQFDQNAWQYAWDVKNGTMISRLFYNDYLNLFEKSPFTKKFVDIDYIPDSILYKNADFREVKEYMERLDNMFGKQEWRAYGLQLMGIKQ